MNRVTLALIGLGLAGLLGCPANAQTVEPYQPFGPATRRARTTSASSRFPRCHGAGASS